MGAPQVLRDCTATVNLGEVVVVCGPSGSGKSTLIKCINGLVPSRSRHDHGRRGSRSPTSRTDLPTLRTHIEAWCFQNFEL
jgi:glutamate/aspartate transport system ATP-binding protein